MVMHNHKSQGLTARRDYYSKRQYRVIVANKKYTYIWISLHCVITYLWNSKTYILPLFAQIEANLKLDYGWYKSFLSLFLLLHKGV